jgi:hypothetical protein
MLKKIYFVITLVFLSLVFSSSFLAFKIKAIAPIPGGRIPCANQKDLEFNSSRPYQASPCGDSPKAVFCGNQLQIVEDTPTITVEGTFTSYPVNFQMGDKNYAVDLEGAEFPIEGNTEDVVNSQSGTDSLSDASKVNEYVSWYLSGVINKAEYGSTKSTANELVNFSGPVQKLLPGAILDAQRMQSIANATEEVTYLDEENASGDEEPVEVTEPTNHNQIVACGGNNLGLIGDILNIGSVTPKECYAGDGSEATGEVFRLQSWEGDLSFWNSAANGLIGIVDTIASLFPFIPRGAIEESVGDHWNDRLPPLPWGEDNDGNPITALKYQKYYNEWRGKTCVIIPIINKLICFDNILVPNKFGDFYSYVPLANTADKNAKNMITGVGIKGSAGTDISLGFPAYKILEEPILYFPHTHETNELAELLNKTYRPGKTQEESDACETACVDPGSSQCKACRASNPMAVPADVESTTDENGQCRILDVRANPGDYLFPEVKPSEVRVYVAPYTVTRVPCVPAGSGGAGYRERIEDEKREEAGLDPIGSELVPMSKCGGEVNIEIRMVTKTPYAKEIFENTVAGEESTFRKIFPKTGEDSPIKCIANLPTVTNVTYIPTEGIKDGKLKVTGPLGNNTTDSPKLYFPHIGSVYEYFLKGIQTALRPKGYGETLTQGKYCKVEAPKDCTGAGSNFSVPPTYTGSFKTNFIDLANRWTSDCPGADNNLAEECYDFVVDKAVKEGVNPAFALTIWLNESGASNYCNGGPTSQDMGINLPDLYQDIVGQAEVFMKMANERLCSGVAGFSEPMHGWLSRFQSSDGVCDPTDTVASDYYYEVKDTTWSFLTSCAQGGKFGITWPTDSSCP